MTDEQRDNQLDPELEDVAWRLSSERPAPRAAFRAELRQRLASKGGAFGALRRRGRRVAIAYGVAGVVALLIAASGLLTTGPLSSPEHSNPSAALAASARR